MKIATRTQLASFQFCLSQWTKRRLVENLVNRLHRWASAFLLAMLSLHISQAQSTRLERLTGISPHQIPAVPLPSPQGLQEHVVNGKLVLSVADVVRLALANDTEIAIDQTSLDFAQNSLHRSYSSFDPRVMSSFTAARTKTPATSQLEGAAVPNSLSQNTQIAYMQTLQSGASAQVNFNASKYSTNSNYYFLNPSYSSTLQFSLTQPLLRNFGFFPSKAPILIARHNLKQAESAFEAQVNSVIFGAITQYWAVVLDRENMAVQKESADAALRSFNRDKKKLSLGAIAPADTYRSEEQVATRRFALIQAEYTLKQDVDALLRIVGGDLPPGIRDLDLELTDNPKPEGKLDSVDLADARSRALTNRPEMDAARLQLASDELNLRLAHNSLRPDLEMSASYASRGLGGNQYDTSVLPSRLISSGGFQDSLHQVFGFAYPTYSLGVSLTLPLKSHAAEASLRDALVTRQHDLYQQRNTQQGIEQDTDNATLRLEQAVLQVEVAKRAVTLAQKSLHAEERKQQLGDEPVFFVLEAQTELARTEASLVQAECNYRIALANLDRATGVLLSRYNIKILR